MLKFKNPEMPFWIWFFHVLLIHTVRPHWVDSCWQIPLAESSDSWSPSWRTHHLKCVLEVNCSSCFLGDVHPEESALAWPFLKSQFFDSSNMCLYFGLITCERCTSSVTAKPRSVWCAQCKNVVWTHNDFLPSVAVALRMATCMHQQNPRVRNRKQRPDCWGPKRQMLKTSAKILNWKIIAVTKNKRCRKTGAVCAVWVFAAPARIVRLQWIIRGTHTLLHHNRGDHFIATTHPTTNSSRQRRWWVLCFLRRIAPCYPLFLLPSSDDLNCQVLLGVLVPAWHRLRFAQCWALPNVSAHANDLVDGVLHNYGVLLSF